MNMTIEQLANFGNQMDDEDYRQAVKRDLESDVIPLGSTAKYLTQQALKSGDIKDHNKAQIAHMEAAKGYKKLGNKEKATNHLHAALLHYGYNNNDNPVGEQLRKILVDK